MVGFLSFGIDITTEMYFIRCFIRREAGIPVNTISTVFGLNPRIVSSNREIRAITVAKKLSNSARAVSYSALCSLNHSRLLFAERSFKKLKDNGYVHLYHFLLLLYKRTNFISYKLQKGAKKDIKKHRPGKTDALTHLSKKQTLLSLTYFSFHK